MKSCFNHFCRAEKRNVRIYVRLKNNFGIMFPYIHHFTVCTSSWYEESCSILYSPIVMYSDTHTFE